MRSITLTAHTPHAAATLLVPVVIAARTHDVLHRIGRYAAAFGQAPWTDQPPEGQDALTRSIQILIVRYDRPDDLSDARRLDVEHLAYRVSEQPAGQWITEAHSAHAPWPLPITLAQVFLQAYNYYLHKRTRRLPDLTPKEAITALLAVLPVVSIEDAIAPPLTITLSQRELHQLRRVLEVLDGTPQTGPLPSQVTATLSSLRERLDGALAAGSRAGGNTPARSNT